jgi:hypothetical protein
MMMAAYAGHLRRGEEGRTPASKEFLRALYTEMRNIDPKSTYGAYAEGALVIWVEGGTLTDQPIPTEINRVAGNDAGNAGSGSSSGSGSGSGTGSGSSRQTAMGASSISDDDVGSVDSDTDDDDGDDF